MITGTLLSNWHLLHLHHSGFQPSCHNMAYTKHKSLLAARIELIRKGSQARNVKSDFEVKARLAYPDNKTPRHNEIWRSGGTAPPFLTSAPNGGEWSASRPCRFTPGERAPTTHWTGSCGGHRAGLDEVQKRKFFTLPGLELRPLGSSARSQSLYLLRYPGSLQYSKTFVWLALLRWSGTEPAISPRYACIW
jgi:hypothetical protein